MKFNQVCSYKLGTENSLVSSLIMLPSVNKKVITVFPTPSWNSFWVEFWNTKTCYSANWSVSYTEFTNINFEMIQWAIFKIIEAKGGHLVKKWEFGQMEKRIIYHFFKTRIYSFMAYGQFPPKSKSRFVIQDWRVRGLRAVTSNH